MNTEQIKDLARMNIELNNKVLEAMKETERMVKYSKHDPRLGPGDNILSPYTVASRQMDKEKKEEVDCYKCVNDGKAIREVWMKWKKHWKCGVWKQRRMERGDECWNAIKEYNGTKNKEM